MTLVLCSIFFFNCQGSGNNERLLRDNDIGGILTHLVPCAAKWKLIGTALNIPQGILTNIEVKPTNMAGAPCSYLIETLTYWTNNMPASTKITLVRALRNVIVNEGRIAQELEQTSF